MDGRCKDCKWWDRESWELNRPRYQDGHYECSNELLRGGSQGGSAGASGECEDYGGDGGTLTGYVVTGPEFGCVHYEPKD